MRLGQTSLIYFVSRLASSVIGFLATLYIARKLGASPLGIFNLTTSLVAWLAIVGQAGVSGAIAKRVSEGEQPSEYAVAGGAIVGGLFAVVTVFVFLFENAVNSYIGYSVAEYLVLILLVSLLFSLISSLLSGFHLVHVRGVLSMLKTGGQSVFQIVAVSAGLGVIGLYLGHIVGFVLVILLGLYYVREEMPGLSTPSRRHFRSLGEYAKYSWLGSLQSKMFNYTDIIVLGFFTSSSLIGIYAVAWNIGQFLILFSGSLKSTLFPEMSKLSAKDDPQAVADLVNKSLAYGGLFTIPGLVGGALIGDRILAIYGSEFRQGFEVLVILILANVIMGYQNQLLNALNAIDRPELSFRVNLWFAVLNISFNIVFIYWYGWVGAAIATATSVGISLVIAYVYASQIIAFAVPVREITKQLAAALLMGAVVYGGINIQEMYGLISQNFVIVLLLVSGGAGVYFTTLYCISHDFRETVQNNVPTSVLPM
jgi:O-antigen/teichoic acid export membrane protein